MAFERVTLAALIALTACRSPRALPDRDQVEIKDVVDAVSYLRGLPPKDSITVHLVTPDVFRKAMAQEMICGGLRTVLIAGELSGPMFDAVLQGTTLSGAKAPPACR